MNLLLTEHQKIQTNFNTHLQNFLQLVLILNNDNIGFTVFRNKVTGLWRICGVNAYSKASEIMGS